MKWRRFIPFALLVPVLILAFQPSVLAQQLGSWTGTTAQGDSISFDVQQGSSGEYIDSWFFGATMNCPDGSQFSLGASFGGFNVPIVNNSFSFQYPAVWPDSIGWSGTFTSSTSAQGKLAMAAPTFVANTIKAQTCLAKGVTWTAAPGSGVKAPAHYDYYLTVTKLANGKVAVSFTH